MAVDRQSVADILKAANKKYDFSSGSIDRVITPVKALTTGNLALDEILSIGGLPEGRMCELYGPPSSGKTTCALQVAGEAQRTIIDTKSDQHILYMDYEHALDKKYTKNLGLDLEHDSVILAQPTSLEKGAQLTRDLVNTGKIKLIVWDSVAEALPEAMAEGDSDQHFVAVRARLMSQFLQQINPFLYKNDCTAIFLNHVMEAIPMGYAPGPPKKKTPGGEALKFYSSVRLEFTQVKAVKSKRFNPLSNAMEDVTTSADVKVKVVKNKVGDPNRECILRVRYGMGFDNFYTAMQILLGYKKIPSTSGYYYFDKLPDISHPDMDRSATDRPNIRTEDALLAFADSHPLWRSMIIDEARKVLESSKGSTEDVIMASEDEELLGGFTSLDELEDV